MARILIGNIKGPKGDTGPQGKQGPTGPQGPKGDTGPMPALINNASTTSAGVGALDAAMGKTLGDRIDVLNNKEKYFMKSNDYNLSIFDFDDPTYPAGSYRIGENDNVLNPPNGSDVYYSNVLVVRYNGSDTLAMLVFPYQGNTGKIYYRQGNTAEWPTAKWYYFQGAIVE